MTIYLSTDLYRLLPSFPSRRSSHDFFNLLVVRATQKITLREFTGEKERNEGRNVRESKKGRARDGEGEEENKR